MTTVTTIRPRKRGQKAPRPGKRTADTIVVEFDTEWLHKLPGPKFNNTGAPSWFRIHIEWLYDQEYSRLTLAERGALLTLVMMVMRRRKGYDTGRVETNRSELGHYKLTDKILAALCSRFVSLKVWVETEAGEIKDL